MQGVADPKLRLTQEQKDNFDQWIYKNGLRWTAEGGPLSPGGVDVAFVGTLYVLYAEWLQIEANETKNNGRQSTWEDVGGFLVYSSG